jgi:hypothetical protein
MMLTTGIDETDVNLDGFYDEDATFDDIDGAIGADSLDDDSLDVDVAVLGDSFADSFDTSGRDTGCLFSFVDFWNTLWKLLFGWMRKGM